mmetsp:Transcript_43582/g.74412  ORF Transcript_43582/g.74412 Transcript_43582/m.74412 type:complete len:93 (-) Transcript_43582:106-384(-)
MRSKDNRARDTFYILKNFTDDYPSNEEHGAHQSLECHSHAIAAKQMHACSFFRPRMHSFTSKSDWLTPSVGRVLLHYAYAIIGEMHGFLLFI